MRIYIPPHTRVQDGKRVDVKGYFRTIDSMKELTPDELRAHAAGEGNKYFDLDELEKESGGYRVSDSALRISGKNGVVEIHADDGGGYSVRSAQHEGTPWHGQGKFKDFAKAKARFLKLHKGTLGTSLLGLTEAQEHLMSLAAMGGTMIGLPRAVVFDIDSTLASGVRREEEVRSGPIRDWAKHHGEMFLDSPIPHTVRKLKQHARSGQKVVLLTLRAERWRGMTEAWLRANDIPFDELVMRPDGETAPSGHTIKQRLYREKVKPFYDVVEAYDDSPSNVEMFQSEGIFTHRVSDPDLPPMEGIPMPDPFYPEGKAEDWGPEGMGYMRDGKRMIYVMPFVRVTENGIENVDGYWREIGLSQAIDHLKLELTRVYVMPHTRITENGAIHVDGYWRDIDFDPISVFDYPDASAAFQGMKETPHEVAPGKFVRESELTGYIADKFETPFEHSTKARPGRTPTKVTVTLRDGTISPTIHVPENLSGRDRVTYIRRTLRAVFGSKEIVGYRIAGDPAGVRHDLTLGWFDAPEDDNFPDGVMNISFDNLTS